MTPLNIPSGLKDEMRLWRRDFHKYPERGWTEFRTTAKIAEQLAECGWPLRFSKDFLRAEDIMGRDIDVEREKSRATAQGADEKLIAEMGGYTGLTAELDAGREGPVLALRFDIDCVECREAKDERHFPAREGFSSVNDGLMHSCGHDGHAAVGLALARLLMDERKRLCGKVVLIFQPAEEGVRGGYAMARGGVADGADYFLTMHLGLGRPTGSVVCGMGGFLCSTKFDAGFAGVGAHAGAEPERGRNALLAAASAALNLHAIAPHSGGATRVNVGVLRAGEGRNVVPPAALMKIETRGEDAQVAKYVYGRSMEVLKGAAAMYGVSLTVTKQGETVGAESDAELAATVAEAARASEGVTRIDEYGKMAGSDDACWLMERVQRGGGKAAYIGIGADSPAGHHNERFDIDEAAMDVALSVLANSALLICGRKS